MKYDKQLFTTLKVNVTRFLVERENLVNIISFLHLPTRVACVPLKSATACARVYVNEMQRRMMEAMFSHDDVGLVEREGVPEALRIADDACREVGLGSVDPLEFVITKRLRRDLKEYRARQPHIVAAMLGADKDMAEYILLNVENTNPFTRVMPASLVDDGHRYYDRKKYAMLVRRAAWNLIRPFIRGEDAIGSRSLRAKRLDEYL